MDGHPQAAIEAEGLVKTFGAGAAGTRALDGFDLTVETGTVCGLLGPNGAGKTTAVRILATLLRPDGGTARVAGHDVVTEAHEVRRRIGLSGQTPAVDEIISGRQNLVLFGRLNRLTKAAARRRADELLARMGLEDAARRPVKTYSGGMRRRLDLAATLILAPDVLFLDEPTTGLDPRSRNEVWVAVRELVAGGTTVLLTTQYLDEADQLADRIVVIDSGRAIADGNPEELKAQVGGDRLDVVVAGEADLGRAAAVVAEVAGAEPEVEPDVGRLSVPVAERVAALTEVLGRLGEAGVEVADIGLRRPTLDDVFLRLTGHKAQAAGDGDDGGAGGDGAGADRAEGVEVAA